MNFDTKWEQAQSAAIEIPTKMVLEVFFHSKLQDSVQLQTVLAFYEQENIRNNRAVPDWRDQQDDILIRDNEDAKLQRPERNSGTKSSNRESKKKKSGRMPSMESKLTVLSLISGEISCVLAESKWHGATIVQLDE